MESLKNIPALKDKYDSLSSWDWLYGNTLEFSHKMDEYIALGFFDFHFKVVDGVIKDLKIFTDCLYPQLVDDLVESLREKNYHGESVKQAVAKAREKFPDLETGLNELEQWLCRNIEI